MRCALIVCVLFTGLVFAAEHAPRVLSPHNADAYSMKTFRQFSRWKDLEGDALAWEIYAYLADTRTGIYPMGAGGWEGEDAMYEFGYVRDPVKMINVYPLGYCDMLGPTMEGVMRGIGFKRARTVNLPPLHHVLCEVQIDGRWCYLDLDLRTAFKRADGTLASMEDSQKDAELWNKPRGPLFFPLDKVAQMQQEYQKTPVEYRYNVNQAGHTMDYVLRRGETFTRWWKPQGDRWSHHESYHKGLAKILKREPAGPKCKHAGAVFTIHTRGNGLFEYKPDLTSKSQDFADGVYGAKNVVPAGDGLTLEKEGEGYAIVEIRSPYVIVPSVGTYETTDDDKEASVVTLDATGVSLQFSSDHGKTWQDVEASSNGRIDLTRFVARTYGGLLKFNFKGKPGEAILRKMEVATWVQVHPASLPSLRKGANEMRYVTGDHYGLPSRVVEIRTNASKAEDFLKWCAEPPKDFNPERKTSRAKGAFVVKVEAPPGAKIAWFSGGGMFCAQQHANGPKTNNRIAYAVDEPKDFKEFFASEILAGQCHWHTNGDAEVKLDRPAKVVYLQYTGDPGVNNLRIYAHCVDEAPRPGAPVTITHAWKEKGELKTKTVTLDKPGPYRVECADDPEDEYVKLEVPSSAGGK